MRKFLRFRLFLSHKLLFFTKLPPFFLRCAAGLPPRSPFCRFSFRVSLFHARSFPLLAFFHPLTSFNLSCGGAMPRRVQLMRSNHPTSPFVVRGGGFARRPFPEIRLLPDGAFAARDGRPGTLTEETSTHGTSPVPARNMCSTNGGGARRLWPSTMSTRASTPATTGSPPGRRLDRVAPVRAGAGAVRVDPVDGRRQGFHRTGRIPFHFPVFSFNPQKRRRTGTERRGPDQCSRA